MSSLDRSLSGDVLVFDLEGARQELTPNVGTSGRNARTLLKSGSLRMTLIVLGPGGGMPEHRAEGPITVQPLDGRIAFTVGGVTHDLKPGQLLATGPGVPHSVHSEGGATFLLTVAHPGS